MTFTLELRLDIDESTFPPLLAVSSEPESWNERPSTMIVELENDAELRAILAKPFEPSAQYDEAGDCIEFFAENVPFNAERLDDCVTMYVAESDGRLVGCLIKRVKSLMCKHA